MKLGYSRLQALVRSRALAHQFGMLRKKMFAFQVCLLLIISQGCVKSVFYKRNHVNIISIYDENIKTFTSFDLLRRQCCDCRGSAVLTSTVEFM